MNSFLHVRVSDVSLILEGDSVAEIIELSDKDPETLLSSGHMSWRDEILPIVVANELLMLPASPARDQAVGVVYRFSPKANPILLIVNEVVRVLNIAEIDFVCLPSVPSKVRLYFDRIFPVSEDKSVAYRLRSPLPDEAIHCLVNVNYSSTQGAMFPGAEIIEFETNRC